VALAIHAERLVPTLGQGNPMNHQRVEVHSPLHRGSQPHRLPSLPEQRQGERGWVMARLFVTPADASPHSHCASSSNGNDSSHHCRTWWQANHKATRNGTENANAKTGAHTEAHTVPAGAWRSRTNGFRTFRATLEAWPPLPRTIRPFSPWASSGSRTAPDTACRSVPAHAPRSRTTSRFQTPHNA
jgi:hypothetical protein